LTKELGTERQLDEVPEVKMKNEKNLNKFAKVLNLNQIHKESSVSMEGQFSLDGNLEKDATVGALQSG
jgi:hypothetical protein